MILDTVVLVRLLRGELSEDVLADMEEADDLAVSAASLFEVNQNVRSGKLAVAPFGRPQIAALKGRGIAVLPLEAEVAATAAAMAWRHAGREHRDPFDRMIAATALSRGWPVATSDRAFADLASVGLRLRPL